MKRFLALALILCSVLSLASCDAIISRVQTVIEDRLEGSADSMLADSEEDKQEEEEGITIPDIIDTDEQTAKTVLANNGLIPTVKHEYNDTTELGNVIRTDPAVGSVVDNNTKVIIYISDGPSYICSDHATISWYNVGSNDDDWNFYAPYIKNGKLYIECQTTFALPVTWKNTGFGTASISDTFDKTVPIVIINDTTEMQAYKEYQFTLEIPLNDLDVQKPTTMYLKLASYVQGVSKNIEINFSITW